MDLAHGGLWPSGEDSVFTHGGWPLGEGRPRFEGIISSQGWSGYGPRSWGILALWGGFGPRSWGMAFSGGLVWELAPVASWPSGGAGLHRSKAAL